MNNTLKQTFINETLYRIDENIRMVTIVFNKIDNDLLWQKPNKALNSIGNLILHIKGNLTQYCITPFTETTDNRNRDLEFSENYTIKKEPLLLDFLATINQCKNVISGLTEKQLKQKFTIQGFKISGLGAVLHSIEHFSYHTGQMAFWVKYINKKSLGFYEGIDLNITS